ncbi:MAG: hypothetical protein HY858_17285 [Candidatus Solibacter usitatus]|nr:hypothetical protein [Candidatus Solibacter usitatus]
MKQVLLLALLLAASAGASPIEGVTLQDPPLFTPSPSGPWFQLDLGNGLIWQGADPGSFDWDLRLLCLPTPSGFFFDPPPTATPEPVTIFLCAAGLAALALARRVSINETSKKYCKVC